jgi:hypothetical protein
MPERCWALVGGHDRALRSYLVSTVRETAGEAARVEADWAWSLEREEKEGDVQGFFHTHPPAAGTAPSQTDIRSMQAWTLALGKPLLCLIAEEHNMEEPSGFLFAEDAGAMRKATLGLEDGKWRVGYEPG